MPDINAEERALAAVRSLTAEQRRSNFIAGKDRMAAQPEVHHRRTTWHEVDDPLTLEQGDQLPDERSLGDSRTRPIWIRYFHAQRRQMVVAKGYYDYDGGGWVARYYPDGDGDIEREVPAAAWAHIHPGERPGDGLIIPERIVRVADRGGLPAQ